MQLPKAARVRVNGSGPFGVVRAVAAALVAAAPFVCAAQAQGQETVSWKTFAQVELERSSNRIAPRFSNTVAALDQKEVVVQGFMLPLDMGEKHARCILSAVPPTCGFCMPGGPKPSSRCAPSARSHTPTTQSWLLVGFRC